MRGIRSPLLEKFLEKKMKKLLTAVVFLLISTALIAQSNTATTTQTGDDNNSTVGQTGANTSEVLQDGNTNTANVGQVGTNTAIVDQLNSTFNTVTVDQDGTGNEAYVTQGMVENYYGQTSTDMDANSNLATVDQDGAGNIIGEFIQVGDNNIGNFTQNGNGNKGYIYQGWAYGFWGETPITSALASYNSTVDISQVNDNNDARVWQYGGDNNTTNINQTGLSNTASISQGFIYEDGAYNYTYPVFNTQDNFVAIDQLGDDNVAKTMQLGDGNQFTLTQNGAGNILGYDPAATALVDKRNAYFEQDGDDNIFVGTQNDGATLKHESFQAGNNNDIDLIQNQGDVALIQQTGDLNTANVYQYGVGNDASVFQTGDNNTANVTQSN
ncbi:MAG: hypothetical protein HND52_16910 [Ignavibacteriae bacterium]|nr:hypothetical protein [Ignavibacteriota bacterium]NOG99641.1 hypothetical protein [Ignavibacteriota bacterium]